MPTTAQTGKHTPGEWICYADLPSTEPNWHIVTTADRMRVIANVHIEPGNQMDEANARLIAAAPDLLEAVRSLVFLNDNHSPFGGEIARDKIDRAWDKARDAVAKAEGRS